MAGELILILDTATTAGSVALCRGERLLAEIVVDSSLNHSDKLLQQVEMILTEQRCSLAEISAFAVIDGPGSFTGLRVGVAAAKGLARACQRPLFSLSSLQLLAAALPYATLPVCALIDARKKEVYAATFSTATGSPAPLDQPCVLPPQRFLAEMKAPALFVGSGAVLYRDLIVERFGPLAIFAPWSLHTPRASSVAPHILQKLQAGESGDPELLLPRYIRPSDAEIAQQKV
ncbi:MAG: tRNA (adenosine(37)-N6)-threonylcarbamoyltransferase complex dimerization subunit type 1 TsaB [Desulfuromonadales bacterium]|nr:tRNA (adenosine(37)-N6)-threonylcarbamoyltransferase complex dimerization subunit type 1 TsaB [Desulfuromonadales bacterium]